MALETLKWPIVEIIHQGNMSMTQSAGGVFLDGDIVAMVGDSITSDGRWWGSLREQVLARRPSVRCDFRNCGISGGSAEGALRGYVWDIAPHHPSLALVMFGMNDVWRDTYAKAPTAAMLPRRAEALDRFLAASIALVERLQADGARVVLLTPTPFDQYAPERPVPNLPGCDDALAVCGGMVRGIAAARHLPLVDLHTPLRRRCAAGEPLITDDRVHPGDAGHEAMCALVLATLCPGPVVDVPPVVRAASEALREAERRQRTFAMFRSWSGDASEGTGVAAVQHYLDLNQEKEQNPWIREQMLLCRALLPQQAELAAEVAQLRQRLAAVAATA